jgi:hypothetical protein
MKPSPFAEEALKFAQEIAEQIRLQNEHLREDLKRMQQTVKEIKQEQLVQSKSQAKTKSQPKSQQIVKKDTKKEQISERELFDLISKEIKAVLMGEKSLRDSKLFEDIRNEEEKIRTALQNTLQEYNNKMKELAEFTEKFNDAHSKLIGLFALMLGKSDLMKHTNEHLFDKMRELILYYPVDVILFAMRSLIVGYFAGKQAGIDTDGMSVGELVAMGENPEVVAKLSLKSLEFLGQLVDAIPQIFQIKVAPYKIQLDKLQNEAKILEIQQAHLERALLQLEQQALNRLKLLEMLLNYLLTAKTREEIARIQAGSRIAIAEMKAKEKDEKKEPQQLFSPEELKKLFGGK